MTNTTAPRNAITWFEIGCRKLAQSSLVPEKAWAAP